MSDRIEGDTSETTRSEGGVQRIRVHPPGPFPPTGEELPGEVDLGVRLRDTLYRRPVVLDARKALHGNIRMASRSAQQVLMALPAIDAFIDTFPLASMIDDAVASWRIEPNPEALTVLRRAADVLGSVLGWPRSVDRRWPLPDEGWMRRQVDGPAIVVPRGPRDGSAAAAVALDAVFGAREIDYPNQQVIHGDELVARVPDLLEKLADDQTLTVDVAGWIPWDDASQEAYQQLVEATPLQSAYARCGLAAIAAGGGGEFADLLHTAPPGELGERMRAVAEAVVVPHLSEEGSVEPHGVLVWDDHYTPVRVNPVITTLIEALADQPTIGQVAQRLKSEPSVVEDVMRQLVEVGAVTAC